MLFTVKKLLLLLFWSQKKLRGWFASVIPVELAAHYLKPLPAPLSGAVFLVEFLAINEAAQIASPIEYQLWRRGMPIFFPKSILNEHDPRAYAWVAFFFSLKTAILINANFINLTWSINNAACKTTKLIIAFARVVQIKRIHSDVLKQNSLIDEYAAFAKRRRSLSLDASVRRLFVWIQKKNGKWIEHF